MSGFVWRREGKQPRAAVQPVTYSAIKHQQPSGKCGDHHGIDHANGRGCGLHSLAATTDCAMWLPMLHTSALSSIYFVDCWLRN
jgi:hypothetical protein